jgi:hypothetical protein
LSKKENPAFDYITAFEHVNDQLVVTLKYYLQLLTEFKHMAPSSEGWQDMMKDFALVLAEAETARKQKTFH